MLFSEERKKQRTVKYHILRRHMTPSGAPQRMLTWDAMEQIRWGALPRDIFSAFDVTALSGTWYELLLSDIWSKSNQMSGRWSVWLRASLSPLMSSGESSGASSTPLLRKKPSRTLKWWLDSASRCCPQVLAAGWNCLDSTHQLHSHLEEEKELWYLWLSGLWCCEVKAQQHPWLRVLPHFLFCPARSEPVWGKFPRTQNAQKRTAALTQTPQRRTERMRRAGMDEWWPKKNWRSLWKWRSRLLSCKSEKTSLMQRETFCIESED